MGKRKIRCKYWGKKRVFHGNQLTKFIVEQEEEAHESDESDIFDDVEEFLDSSSAKLWECRSLATTKTLKTSMTLVMRSTSKVSMETENFICLLCKLFLMAAASVVIARMDAWC